MERRQQEYQAEQQRRDELRMTRFAKWEDALVRAPKTLLLSNCSCSVALCSSLIHTVSLMTQPTTWPAAMKRLHIQMRRFCSGR